MQTHLLKALYNIFRICKQRTEFLTDEDNVGCNCFITTLCICQVWIQASGSWIQFREAYPSTAMAIMYKPKSRLKLNARKVAAGDYQYQATVVWPEGKAPLDYRTKEWWDDLQRTVSCLRNRVEITAHLSSSSPREAVVQEYISWETGLLRMLDEDKSVALFALENFWTSHDGEFKPLR